MLVSCLRSRLWPLAQVHHVLRPILSSMPRTCRCRPVDQKRSYFWEPSKRSLEKYDVVPRAMEEAAPGSLLYWGMRIFINECGLFLKQFWELLQADRPLYETDQDVVIWKFNNETIKKWIVTKDADWGEGYSTAKFEMSPSGHGLYHGFLDTKTFPKDRTISRVGWSAITCPPPRLAFFREGRYDWEAFTHMVLRVRGDGRTYAITMRTPGTFDVTYYDQYSFGLYTTGGPYWQYVKIPFSRFIFMSRGSVQDFQQPIELFNVQSFSICAMDKIHGPFRLEIDSVALFSDPCWNEESQYEMYYIPQAKYNSP